MNPFLEACGASGPLALEIEDQAGRDNLRRGFAQPFVVLGRDPRTDLTLDHWQVSRRHAYLQMIEGRVFCIDLGSRTGTRWGSVPGRAGWIARRRPLHVGPFKVHVADGENAPEATAEPPSPLAARSPGEDPLPQVALEFSDAGTGRSTWPMSRALALVGRGPGCRPRVAHPSVSKYHCALVRTPSGVWVVDLLGREGVQVNGQAVRVLGLADGDVLRVGDFAIRVRLGPLAVPEAGGEDSRVLGRTASGSAARDIEAPGAQSEELEPRRHPGGAMVPYLRPRPPASAPAAPAEVWRPPGPDAGHGPGPLASDPLLAQLTSQFGAMQQQMFDQFHQAMMMMVQTFGNLHREQMEHARAELDRLRLLAQELQTLQAEEARRYPRPGIHPPAPSPESRTATGHDNLPDNPRPSVAPAITAGGLPATSTMDDSAALTDPGIGSAGTFPSDAEVAVRTGAHARPPIDLRAEERGEQTAQHLPPPAAGRSADAVCQDMHWELSQRIAAIQQERQNRWQQLLNLVTGGHGGSATP